MSRNAPPPQAGFWDEIRKIPPVTRTLVGATLAVSVPVMLEIMAPYKLLFVLRYVKGGQLWRIPTSFFLGGGGLAFLFDLMMLYRNSNALESVWYSRRSSDYAYQLFLSSAAILGLNIPLNTFVHYRALLACITYLNSRLSPETPMSIFGLVTVKNLYFPFALLLLDLLQGGPSAAMISLTGIMAGHLWFMLEWTDRGAGRPGRGQGAVVGRAPAWLRKWIETDAAPGEASQDRRPYGTARAPRGQESATTTGHSWGRGNVLGST